MKKLNYKILIICTMAIFSLHSAYASTVTLTPSNTSVSKLEQFYVDVSIDTEGSSINGIEGNINFPNDKLSFIRAEEGKSVINLWIESPKEDRGTISFAGIIPNGFSGFIDPFNSSVKKPGLVFRLVFEPKSEGAADISTSMFTVTENNGDGTSSNLSPVHTMINISKAENRVEYKSNADSTPTLIASVTRDPNLFDNKYTLVFDASDKGAGIDKVMIKEGNHEWKEINSPYLLEDQSRHSTIVVRATNFSGNNTTVTIDPIPYNLLSPSGFILLVALIITALYFIRRKYVNKKKDNII